MLNIRMSELQIEEEIERIKEFIAFELKGRSQVVIAISGGLDSDVVARLVCRVPSVKKIKMFIVVQHDMDPKHIQNARNLANDLGEKLIEISLEKEPFQIIEALKKVDMYEKFHSDGLDVMRMKCSLRTCLMSFYQDHEYIVLGTRNRTEYEIGFYLPFGDGIAHINPIQHLYKTQVKQIARILGTREEVIAQPASAGFWLGEEDLEDLAWWIFNEKPITKEIISSKEDDEYVKRIKEQLSTEKVDQILVGLFNNMSVETISSQTKVGEDVIIKFKKLVVASEEFKHRGYNKTLLFT